MADILLLYSLPHYSHALVSSDTPERLVATAAALRLPGFAFVCYVVVDAAWRRKGIGRRVVEELMSKIEEPECMLTATAVAYPMYTAIGYVRASADVHVRLYTLDRQQVGRANAQGEKADAAVLAPKGVRRFTSRSAESDDLDKSLALVAEGCGGAPDDSRSALLRAGVERGGDFVAITGGAGEECAASVCFARYDHSDGLFVGPLVASSVEAGCAVLEEVLQLCEEKKRRGDNSGRHQSLKTVLAMGIVRHGGGVSEMVFERAGFDVLVADVPLLKYAKDAGRGNPTVDGHVHRLSPRYLALAGYEHL